MPLTIKHSKVSPVADGPDTNLVRPSDWNADHQITGLDSITDPVAVSVDSTSPALKITQTGTGNALVVEDSASTDSTPFVVDTSGRVFVGSPTGIDLPDFFGTSRSPQFEVISDTYSGSSVGVVCNPGALTGSGSFTLAKSRGSNAAPNTLVANGDFLGVINFSGNDGAAFIRGASITSAVDGTPGVGDMPGRLIFSTTPDNSATPTERMRIDSAGNVGIGTTAAVGRKLEVKGNATGAVNSSHVMSGAAVQSDVTTTFNSFASFPSTQATTFTLGELRHFSADQSSFGAGSTVTNQYGFLATGTLTGATNNYGFYSSIASGTGRWNFYAGGTAPNYFAGSVGIGTTSVAGYNLYLSKMITGATTAYNIACNGTIASDVTGGAFGVSTYIGTQAASFTTGGLRHFSASQGAIGAGSTVTTQYGFSAESTLTGATNNYGFYGNIPAGTGRYNFYAAGTADNIFNGNVRVINGSATIGYGAGAGGTVSQTGDRTTGVTLSKPTGAITLVSAAGSTAWQSFTVTNTVVAADDVIKVCQKSGTDKYMIHVTNVAAGSFQITFATTGGTTTEQPVFSFAIIKGATA